MAAELTYRRPETATPWGRILASWPIAAAIAVAGALLAVFWAFVPLNMDEFVAYQTLACFYHPNGAIESHCYPCASFYLRILGTINLPLLSYDYIGSLSSLLYAPVFWLWPDPLSARATGILALAVQAWLLARLFHCRASLTFCAVSLFLPYSFVHIVDTGPVAFQTTSIFAIVYLLKRWLFSSRRSRRLLLLALAGVLVGCSFWVKPTFFFASGGLAILAGVTFVSAVLRRPGEWIWRAMEYVLFTLCAAALTLLVFQAQRPSGDPYLAVLGTDYVPSQIVFSELGTRFRENVLRYVLHPLDAAGPCFNLAQQAPIWGLLTFLVGAAGIGAGLAGGHRPSRHRLEIALLCALFLLSLALVATNIYAKSMHHAVLAYPFAIMAAARCVSIRRHATLAKALLGLFVMLNGCLFLQFPALHERSLLTSESKAFAGPLNTELNASCANNSVVLCTDWGLYFIKKLYGPRSQIVLSWCSPDDEGQLRDATEIARAYGRNLVVVMLADNGRVRDVLPRRFARISETVGGGAGSPWRICLISHPELEPTPAAPSMEGVRPPPR